jgi:kumamolisin
VPSYQAHANVPVSINANHRAGRGVPDVCGNASVNSGYRIYLQGRVQVIGGTSAVAPLWAGLIALLNESTGASAGLLQPLLYGQGGGVLHDITSGNNDITGRLGGYAAEVGWDACTGLGSPDGEALLQLLKG